MKIGGVSIIFVLFCFSVFAQISEKGKPYSFDSREIKSEIPLFITPKVDAARLMEEDNHINNHKSMRYAQIIEVDINILDEGLWQDLANGDKLCLYRVKSDGAYSIGINFSRYYLPEGSKLFMYNVDKTHYIGAFTSWNNKTHGGLALSPVQSDEIIIEYYQPKHIENKAELIIGNIAHDYKDIFSYLKNNNNYSSGACNVDINCEEGDNWQEEKRSVCKITYNGWLCTGALLNNTRNDGTPYFLTANHCINTIEDAQDAVFYFDYENIDCDGSVIEIPNTLSGSSLIALAPQEKLDFSLLLLSTEIPGYYNPYMSGWSTSQAPPLESTTIHHPIGDVKKISIDEDQPEITSYGSTYSDNSHWWIKDWEVGTTEGGSSGAPLYDENHRIIGDLTGGQASCSYNFNDYFAAFHKSWNDYSSANNQLKAWLDPDNSGIIAIDGYQPYSDYPSNLQASTSGPYILLNWSTPNTMDGFEKFYIYRNSILFDSTGNSYYLDDESQINKSYSYYVTAIYDGFNETDPSNKVFYYMMNALSIPYTQTFEDTDFPVQYWYQEGDLDKEQWIFKNGGYNQTPEAAIEGDFNMFFFASDGSKVKLVSPKFDLSTTGNALLEFYLALPEFMGSIHTLNVYYKNDEENDWQILRRFSDDLPDWTKVRIPLINLSRDYHIAFEGVGNKGLGICIDSVQITNEKAGTTTAIYTNDQYICSGGEVEISTNETDPSSTYEWSFGEGAIPNTATGIGPHSVTYNTPGEKDINLKINNSIQVIKSNLIEVFEIPQIPTIVVTEENLISSLSTSYQWYHNDTIIEGAIGRQFDYTKTGSYHVEITNQYNCSNRSLNKFMYVGTTNIEETGLSSNLKIYPNPTDDILNIDYFASNSNEDIRIRISNSSGQQTYSSYYSGGEIITIDLTGFKEGIYILEIEDGDKSYTSKFVVSR